MLDYTFFHECFNYDCDTGLLTWKIRPKIHFESIRAMSIANAKYPGKIAGCNYLKHTKRYVKVGISGVDYYVHHIILIMNNIEIEKGFVVDHIDGDGTNNLLSNLRLTTVSGNCRNQRLRATNKSGHVGVGIHKQTGKWRAYIYDGKKQVALGLFDDIEDAIKAREIANKEHEYHSNHGSKRPL